MYLFIYMYLGNLKGNRPKFCKYFSALFGPNLNKTFFYIHLFIHLSVYLLEGRSKQILKERLDKDGIFRKAV